MFGRVVTVGAGGFVPGVVFSRAERGWSTCGLTWAGPIAGMMASKTWVPMHDSLAESSYFGTERIAPDIPLRFNVVFAPGCTGAMLSVPK